jgi:hypothetical protein
MRSLARWSVVIAFICAVVLGGAAPVFDHAPASTSATATSADGSSSGFKAQPAPEQPAYVGPGVAISGSTVVNASAASPWLAAWRLPSRAPAASSPALHVSHRSPHLRSIPLLI